MTLQGIFLPILSLNLILKFFHLPRSCIHKCIWSQLWLKTHKIHKFQTCFSSSTARASDFRTSSCVSTEPFFYITNDTYIQTRTLLTIIWKNKFSNYCEQLTWSDSISLSNEAILDDFSWANFCKLEMPSSLSFSSRMLSTIVSSVLNTKIKY